MKTNKYLSILEENNNHYKKFIQFSIKKGKKQTVENIFKKALFKAATKQSFFWKNVDNAINNTTIQLNVKAKRKGSKNIYIPIKIKKKYSKFLAYNWILNDIKKSSKTKFHNNFINEIILTSQNKSNASKKKEDIYKLVEENMNNIWIK